LAAFFLAYPALEPWAVRQELLHGARFAAAFGGNAASLKIQDFHGQL
jgi:hypothetical protein